MEPLILTNTDFRWEIVPLYSQMGDSPVVDNFSSASTDKEIADGSFHVLFGIMRQLYKALPSLWGQWNHSYSPIWTSDGR